MRLDKSTFMLPGIILFSFLLVSCAAKESQPFIFGRENSENQIASYYVTDLYDPSNINELNIIPCDTGDLSVHLAQPVWAPNGKYYGCSTMYDKPLIIYNMQNRITAELGKGDPSDLLPWILLGWSPDSQYVMIVNTGSLAKPYEDLSVMKYDGTAFTQLARSTTEFTEIHWSPNGKVIAYELFPTSNNGAVLVIIDPSGKEIARFDLSKSMPTDQAFAEQITWSPDSQKLAFETSYNFESDSKLYVLDIRSGKFSDIIPDKALCIFDIFGWSPDSEKLLFDAVNCREHRTGDFFDKVTYSINVDGSGLKPLTPKGYGHLSWTPDGKSIIVDGYGGRDISVMDVDGKNKRVLVKDGYFLNWINQ
jgi:Tol biopolymer transport system component